MYNQPKGNFTLNEKKKTLKEIPLKSRMRQRKST